MSQFIPCPDCGAEIEATAPVLDCWFCSGRFLADWQSRSLISGLVDLVDRVAGRHDPVARLRKVGGL
jgi:hypothetical protein